MSKVDILGPFGCPYSKRVKAEAVLAVLRDIRSNPLVRTGDPYFKLIKRKSGVYVRLLNLSRLMSMVDPKFLDDEYVLLLKFYI